MSVAISGMFAGAQTTEAIAQGTVRLPRPEIGPDTYSGANSYGGPSSDGGTNTYGGPSSDKESSRGRQDNFRQQMSVQIPVAAPAFKAQAQGNRALTQIDLVDLSRHDVVLVIDKSSSMKEQDCPSLLHHGWPISRWQWCKEQTMELARQTSSVLPQGLSVVLFSTSSHVFPHVTMNDLPQIFAAYSPGGFTNEAGAVGRTFADYFQRREIAHGKIKPLLIAVITDGLPTNPQSLRDVIVDATKEMRRPDEIKMTFLQVGSDPKGLYFVSDLGRDLKQESAKYDIVSSKTFPELLRAGLTRALVDCIREPR